MAVEASATKLADAAGNTKVHEEATKVHEPDQQ
jgi:hypothetical protein